MKHTVLFISGMAGLLVLLSLPVHAQMFTQVTDLLPPGTFGCVGDYDGDGDSDIAITGSAEPGVHYTSIFRNDNGIFTDINAGLLGVYWSSAAWGDFDNDNDLDLIVIGDAEEVHHTTLYRNDGGVFSEVLNTGFVNIRMGAAVWGDYDWDGDLDLLLVGQRGGHGSSDNVAEIYRNEGGTFVNINAGLTGLRHASAIWFDYDNDGDQDIVMCGTVGWDEPGSTLVYTNDNGAFVLTPTAMAPFESATMALGHFSNHIDTDLMIAGYIPGTGWGARIYTSSFEDTGLRLDFSEPGTAKVFGWADFDHDFDFDLLVSSPGASKIFRNDGTPGFSGVDVDLPGVAYGSVCWFALDDDDDADLLLVGTDGITNIAQVYKSNIEPENVVRNGEFNQGTSHWTLYSNGNSSWETAPPWWVPQQLYVSIISPGTNTQVYQNHITLEPNTQYRLSFSASSWLSHNMTVAIHKHGAPYTNYGLERPVQLTRDEADFVFEFTTRGFSKTTSDARLRFSFNPFAVANESYMLDHVLLQKIEPVAQSPFITVHPEDRTVAKFQTATFSVTATGTPPLSYQWQKDNVNIATATNASYTTPPVALADNGSQFRCIVTSPFGTAQSNPATLSVVPAVSVVANSSFEEGIAHWSFFTNGAGNFSTSPHHNAYGENCALISVATAGTNVQLYQAGLSLEPFTTYTLSFQARSNTGNNMAVFLQKHVAPYTNFGVNNWVVDLTDDWQAFARTFTTTGFASPTANARLRFWFAPYDAAGDQFFIDDVWFVKTGPGKNASGAEVPGMFALHQNYPNPFNPATVVSYDLPVAAQVSLKVYDLLGREIAVLVDGMQEAGYKSVEWDAGNVASGVYFYRLTAGEFTAVRKMVVTK